MTHELVNSRFGDQATISSLEMDCAVTTEIGGTVVPDDELRTVMGRGEEQHTAVSADAGAGGEAV
jgi:hypothetical protein